MTEQSPPLAGVVGWPIGHARSPALHGHWLRRYGINGFYIPVGLAPADFEGGLRALQRLGFRGVNVTIPHKEAALALATIATPRAVSIGASNMLSFRPDGTIEADNTDGYGFLQNLSQMAPSWSAAAGPALVLGAGGAARAVIAALLSAGTPEVWITNRTGSRAEQLRDHFGSSTSVIDWVRAEDAVAAAMTIVNTTSLGMTGQPDLSLRLDAAPRGALVTDIVYRPLETPLLAQARALGLTTVDGLGMLLHQAVPAFQSWFGVAPSVDDDLRAAVLGA